MIIAENLKQSPYYRRSGNFSCRSYSASAVPKKGAFGFVVRVAYSGGNGHLIQFSPSSLVLHCRKSLEGVDKKRFKEKRDFAGICTRNRIQ